MFIAMNRFKVMKQKTHEFEDMWLTRESSLHTLPGFVSFYLLKGPEKEDHILYSSHTVWKSFADFEGWTKSDAFQRSHARAENRERMTTGHPEFEGFHVLQQIQPNGIKTAFEPAE